MWEKMAEQCQGFDCDALHIEEICSPKTFLRTMQHEIIGNIISMREWWRKTHLRTSEFIQDCKNHTTTPTSDNNSMKFTKGFVAIFYRKLGTTGRIISKNLLCTDKVYRVREIHTNVQLRRAANYLLNTWYYFIRCQMISVMSEFFTMAEWPEKSGCWV